MLKPLVKLFIICLLGVGGYKAWLELAPAETQIRWVLENAADGFNNMNKADCLAAFAPEYRDSTEVDDYVGVVEVSRSLLGNGLTYMFMNKLEPGTKTFIYKAEAVSGTMNITLDSEVAAKVQFRLDMFVKEGHKWTLVWGLDVKASLRKDETKHWIITRSTHRTVSGHPPFPR